MLSVRNRLILGFAAMGVIIAVATGFTLYEANSISTLSHRMVDLRVPTSAASAKMVNDINASLASLRGWMLTGNDAFRLERDAVWTDIDAVTADLDRFSQNWTNPANVQVWADTKVTLEEFRIAQKAVEDVANTPGQFPANVILLEQAAPTASVVIGQITAMINEELTLEATAARKELLGMMADFRGSMALALANIRAYLLSGNISFAEEFERRWATNDARFASLNEVRGSLTASQNEAFEALSTARAGFAPLPGRMFEIRGSNQWDMANYLLISEAAPRAGSILTTLAGPKDEAGARHGGMVDNQRELLNIDAEHSNEELANLRNASIALLVIGLGLAVVITLVTARAIVTPISAMTDAMKKLAGGDNTVEIPATERTDEIGEMAGAVQVFKDNAIEKLRLEADEKKAAAARTADEAKRAEEKAKQAEEEQQREAHEREEEKKREAADRKREEQARAQDEERKEEERQRAEEDRQKEQAEAAAAAERQSSIDAMTNSFGESVAGILGIVSEGASGMEKTAESMSEVADKTLKESITVASAAEQATANVQTVATATEELSSSISEINRQVSQSSEITQTAVTEASQTTQTMEELATSAARIGEVVSLINDIAEQTNLLALNATIEAARAGESGKGFAVVASEVKNLASQTAKATEEIGTQINSIQQVTDDAVGAIDRIAKTIGNINEISGTIASAVEQQGAATLEISRNIQEAASGTQSVTQSIQVVKGASEETGGASGEVVAGIKDLVENFGQLRGEVETFLTDIKSA
jgi:methyl-accepting chemotaxis protein